MLKDWQTPFMNYSLPNVYLQIEKHLGNVLIFVDAETLWKVSFDNILGIKVCEEAYDENGRFPAAREEDYYLSSYIWEDSPWLAEFSSIIAEYHTNDKVLHYVLTGGDHNIEILATGDVNISKAT